MAAFWCMGVTPTATGTTPALGAANTPVHGVGLAWWLWWPLGWALGLAWQLQQPVLWAGPVYKLFVPLALVCIGFSAIALVRPWAGCQPRLRWALVACLVGATALLAAGSTGWRAQQRQAQWLNPGLEGQTLLATVVVDDLPRATPQGWRFAARTEPGATLAATGQPAHLPSRVVLGWYAPAHVTAPRAGERWRVALRLRQPHGLSNPHGFDSELWLWEQGVGATGYVRTGPKDPAPQRLAPATWGIDVARERVRDAVYAHVPDRRVAGVLAALTVGDQAAIERADWDVFRTTGVAHLMSISGLHITLWAWLATGAVARLWRWAPRLSPVWGSRLLLACPAPVAAAWGGGVLALAYALFSGWGIPAQRTVLMLAVVLGLRLLGRRWPWVWVAAVAMAVVLAWDPWAALQPGFWLSFVAVGVLLATDDRPARTGEAGENGGGVDSAGWRDAPPPFTAPGLPWRARVRLATAAGWGALVQLGRTQGRISLALAPLSLVLFGQVSLVGLVANLVAIPWVTFVVTPLALGAVLLPWLWGLAAGAVAGLVQGLAWASTWPGAAWAWPVPPPVLAVAALLGGLVAVARLPLAFRALGLALALPALLHQPQRPAPGEFELLAADVGQGSAVRVRTATATVLVDAGPAYAGGDAGQRVLLPLLSASAEAPTDLVLSHSDTDHVGGALAVLARHPQAAVWASFSPPDLATAWSDTAQLAAESQAVLAGQRRWTRCEAGQHWVRDGVRFDVLHPTPGAYEKRTASNNLSCVVWVRGTHGAALLTGDLDAAHEAQLLARHPEGLPATVLMAPHHGSKHSSSPPFLAAVAPQWVLVQAGHRNRYGHPAPEALARYQAQGARWVATPGCGALTWHSAQPAQVGCHRQVVRRYWHWMPPRDAPALDPDSPEPPALVW